MKNAGEPEWQIAQMADIDRTIDEITSMYFSRLMALSDIVNRYVNIALKGEVNWLRLRTLIILTGLGKGTITPSELAKNLLRPNQNVTKIVDGLEKDGLVKKLREPGDRRMITIRITDAGLDYIRQSLKRIALAEKELRLCLDENELQAIATSLAKFRSHLVGLLSKDPNHLRIEEQEDI
jgi:DNA-binding MarR family transcriptional regulator